MSSIGTVSIDLEARLAKFESDFGRAARIAEREMQRMQATINRQSAQIQKTIEGVSASVGNVFKGLAIGGAVAGIAALGKSVIDVGDNLNDMSKQFGISTQALSIWRLSAEK